MDPASLTALLTSILALSMAVERIIEVLKGLLPKVFTNPWPGDWEFVRCAVLRLLSGIVGYFIAKYGNLHFLKFSDQFGWFLLGTLSAGGSAFWNHLLDIVKSSKVKDEVAAKAAAGTTIG